MSSVKAEIPANEVVEGLQTLTIVQKAPPKEASANKSNGEMDVKYENPGEQNEAKLGLADVTNDGRKGIRRRKFSSAPTEEKPIVEKGLKGRVKWFSVRACYGFIERYDSGGDVFVHQMGISTSNIRTHRYRSLAESEEVMFDLAKSSKGYEAVNVSAIDGGPVLGVPIMIFFRNNNRRIVSEGTEFIPRRASIRENRSKSENRSQEKIPRRSSNYGNRRKLENQVEDQDRKPNRRVRRRRRNNAKRANSEAIDQNVLKSNDQTRPRRNTTVQTNASEGIEFKPQDLDSKGPRRRSRVFRNRRRRTQSINSDKTQTSVSNDLAKNEAKLDN